LFGHITIMGGTRIMGRALESVILGKRLVGRPNIRWLFQLPRRRPEDVRLSINRKRKTVGRDRVWQLRSYPLKDWKRL
jgi:hypothetical protein